MNNLLFDLFEQNTDSNIKILFTNGRSDIYDYHDEEFRNSYKESPNLFKMHRVNSNDYVYINSEHITAVRLVTK